LSKAALKFGDQCPEMCTKHARRCGYVGEGNLASLRMDLWDKRHKHSCFQYPFIDGKEVMVHHYWRGVKHEFSSTYRGGKHKGYLDRIEEAEAERQLAFPPKPKGKAKA
jgi:hypothetical protein